MFCRQYAVMRVGFERFLSRHCVIMLLYVWVLRAFSVDNRWLCSYTCGFYKVFCWQCVVKLLYMWVLRGFCVGNVWIRCYICGFAEAFCGHCEIMLLFVWVLKDFVISVHQGMRKHTNSVTKQVPHTPQMQCRVLPKVKRESSGNSCEYSRAYSCECWGKAQELK